MGAWGIGIFENDEANDYILDLIKSGRIDMVCDSLDTVIEGSRYPGATDSMRALAAISIVKSIITGDYSELPSHIIGWAKEKDPKVFIGLLEKIQKVISIIKERSELKDLWSTTSDYDRWQGMLDKIEIDFSSMNP